MGCLRGFFLFYTITKRGVVQEGAGRNADGMQCGRDAMRTGDPVRRQGGRKGKEKIPLLLVTTISGRGIVYVFNF
ncbi:hypothetical protein ADH70_014570 [Blautia pseudococcoides]|uniref:Uncharacterized protein n=1 Tax=Blautia pseudococcoides TaxID=1796616 RepID=A0A1C7IDP1_9FIRM|nr:hypothetical protein A4V09_16045 [Blautia pseudococcoides]ASU29935.1 hypothetical protein ADH70_014570 [Blautia pseudococcoides]